MSIKALNFLNFLNFNNKNQFFNRINQVQLEIENIIENNHDNTNKNEANE